MGEPVGGAATIRRARGDDLGQIWQAYWDSEHGEGPEGMPPIPVPSIFEHELTTGELWVAEAGGDVAGGRTAGGDVAGFTALITRPGPDGRREVSYLAEFFVRRAYQALGVGRALLGTVLRDLAGPPGGSAPDGSTARVFCALSSSNPRALALYIRAGMLPRWPNFHLEGRASRLASMPGRDVRVIEAGESDPAIIEWDARVGGRFRPQDHAYWRNKLGARAAWLERRGKRIGYAFLSLRRHGERGPTLALLGPIGTPEPGAAAGCVGAACLWAQSHGDEVHLALPGPHPGLRPLLEAGLHLSYLETFVSSEGPPVADPRCYVSSGGPEGSSLF